MWYYPSILLQSFSFFVTFQRFYRRAFILASSLVATGEGNVSWFISGKKENKKENKKEIKKESKKERASGASLKGNLKRWQSRGKAKWKEERKNNFEINTRESILLCIFDWMRKGRIKCFSFFLYPIL